jgi:hypothetical protein
MRLASAWFLIFAAAGTVSSTSAAWMRHTIDDSSRGADGVRLADFNADGSPDIVTGWEEGGVVRVYLNPGAAKVKSRWPSVSVGKVAHVEDAVAADLDGDGALDVISAAEGATRALFIHWGPKAPQLLDPAAWKSEPFTASQGKMMWMFSLPLQVDGRHGLDLIAGGKGGGAKLGWWEAPANPRQHLAWKWHPLRSLGWLMSLQATDMDDDGDLDIVFSDRKGERTGAFWLERPNEQSALAHPWPEHAIGGLGREFMFLKVFDLDKDGLQDVIGCAKPAEILFLRRLGRSGREWSATTIPFPPEKSGRAKAVNAGDIDRDGKPDLVFTCESAGGNKSGVMWLRCDGSPGHGPWRPHDISGPEGIKFDLVELLDLDGDGDLDVLTCEEAAGLGVIWYENPS